MVAGEYEVVTIRPHGLFRIIVEARPTGCKPWALRPSEYRASGICYFAVAALLLDLSPYQSMRASSERSSNWAPRSSWK